MDRDIKQEVFWGVRRPKEGTGACLTRVKRIADRLECNVS